MKSLDIYISVSCILFIAASGCSDESIPSQNAQTDVSLNVDVSSDVGMDVYVEQDATSDFESDQDEIPECGLGFVDCTEAPGCETSEADPAFFFYEDADEDEFGDPTTQLFFCDETSAKLVMLNPVHDGTDCDDTNRFTHPGAEEICDGQDNNCDSFDDAAPQTLAPIRGVGDICTVPTSVGACALSANLCTNTNGVWELTCPQTAEPRPETCNGLDDDCDGQDDTADIDTSDGTNVVGQPCIRPTVQQDGSINLCAASTYSCVPQGNGDVPLSCLQVIQPVAEEPGFDGIDSNCDGKDQ